MLGIVKPDFTFPKFSKWGREGTKVPTLLQVGKLRLKEKRIAKVPQQFCDNPGMVPWPPNSRCHTPSLRVP